MMQFGKLMITAMIVCGVAPSVAAEHPDMFPIKTVRLVVPFPPGGGSDAVARVLASKLGVLWGHTVVVENRGGAGGNIGSAAVARAPADGYTLILGNTATHAINASLYKNLTFDLRKDFRPIAYVGAGTHVLAVNPQVQAKTVSELVALAKTKGNALNYASFGNGSTSHLAGEMMNRTAGIAWTHVPYRGTGPAVVDLLGGQVDAMFIPVAAAISHLKTGQLRGLAVTSNERSAFLPGLPTMIEEGFDGFDVNLWYGVFAPTGIPDNVVKTLYESIQTVLHDTELVHTLASQGMEAKRLGAGEFEAMVLTETEKWAEVVLTAGVTVD